VIRRLKLGIAGGRSGRIVPTPKGPRFAVSHHVRLRNLGLFAALTLALIPAPARAQGIEIKTMLKNLIEKSGIYVSMSTRTAIDDDVNMGPSLGISYGTASLNPRSGKKFPFSFSSFGANLETADTKAGFGRIKSQQIMSGIGYQWVRGKMIYSAQLGLGYAFNSVRLEPGVAQAFGVPEPVSVTVSNSFVVRPQVKAEYFVHPKISVKTQLGYTYTDPEVVVHSAVQEFAREWKPHHVQLSVALGFFPLRK
jgi:hypothetical protein